MVPQQAWIYSGTVRENILFGSKYNKNIFDEVVESAALKPDLKQWPNGDQTEVGERGLSLSGGQKQVNISVVTSSGILKAKHKLGITFNSDKLGGIAFTKISKLTMCSA